MANTSNRYDQVAYPDFIHPRLDPSRLAAIARLHGLDPIAPSQARVLEIGCGQGGNLLSLASLYPNGIFVGIDQSRNQIAAGESLRASAEITNARFHCGDIAVGAGDDAPFDYILAHGIYSWVTPEVQRKILDVCRDALSPQGIAMISYNTYPGWHMKSAARDILRHLVASGETITSETGDPVARIAAAKEQLAAIAEAAPIQSAYGMMLRESAAIIAKSNPAYLHHEQFEAINEPCLFTDFASRLHQHDLSYIADAKLVALEVLRLPAETRQSIAQLPWLIGEQRLDFLVNRTFRESIIAKSPCDASPEIDPARIAPLHLATNLRFEWTSGDIPSQIQSILPVRYRGPGGQSGSISRPVTKAIIAKLASVWPETRTAESLFREAMRNASLSPADLDSERRELLSDCVQLVQGGLLQIRFDAAPLTQFVTANPCVSRLTRMIAKSRLQAQASLDVPTRRHESVTVDTATAMLIMQLDGTRNHAQIATDWAKAMAANQVPAAPNLEAVLSQHLRRLATAGFFMAPPPQPNQATP